MAAVYKFPDSFLPGLVFLDESIRSIEIDFRSSGDRVQVVSNKVHVGWGGAHAAEFTRRGKAMIRRWRRPFAVVVASLAAGVANAPAARAPRDAHLPDLREPIAIYSQAAISVQGPAAIPANEELALRELDELVRLKKAGMRFDYDLMDASWFEPDGAYRALRMQDWPNGPDAWISKCRAAGVRPGLRIGDNKLGAMQSAPQWKASLDKNGAAMSLFEGGFLPDLMSALDTWYDRGIRLFAIGPIDLTAATPASEARLTRDEIVARNSAALQAALRAFRIKNRDAVLLVLTGPGAGLDSPAQLPADRDLTGTSADFRPGMDQSGAFQMMSTGEPQLSSSPQADFSRSIDIANDGAVRRFEQSGVPLRHIESAGFVLGESSDPNPRVALHGAPSRDWKGAFLLAMAHGGWVNAVHGNLQLIRSDDALWMARAQRLFFNLQVRGRIHSFGGPPGSGQPYGFAGATARGSVYVVVNPSLAVAPLVLPPLEAAELPVGFGRIQFRDAGFIPRLRGTTITLGPGQMAVVGRGSYAAQAYSFGVQQDIVIPNSIQAVDADFQTTDPATIQAHIEPPIEGVLRVVVRERTPANQTLPNMTNSALTYENAAQPLTVEVTQSGRPIPVRINGRENAENEAAHDEPNWLVAEVDVNDLTPGVPVSVQFHSNLGESADLVGTAYQVVY